MSLYQQAQQTLSQGAAQARDFVSASKMKDILIGILIGIIVFYALVSCLIAGGRPGIIETMSMYSSSGNFWLVVILAIAFGVLAWWVASRKTPKTQQ